MERVHGRADQFRTGEFHADVLRPGAHRGGYRHRPQAGRLHPRHVAEELLAYFILFSVAISFFYNFVFHAFFGELAASFIGWADSPFQAEVGYASLGFAAIGFLAFKSNCMLRLAAILGPAMFQWGAAVGHILDIMTTGNVAPGNAGLMLYSDILLPVIGFALLWFKRSTDASCSASGVASR